MEEVKTIKIKGVTGIRYLSFFDRADGRRDASDNQICKAEGGLTTPRILQKCRCCDEYMNELYLKAKKELHC